MQPSFLNLKVAALHCKASGTFHKEALETLESECNTSMRPMWNGDLQYALL